MKNDFSGQPFDGFKVFVDFDEQSLKDGVLSVKEKELIAVAVAHTTGCPYLH
jgi:alkylhydroperoxidase/carboxymuconolactone decarboxylase family protein YurZ